MGLGELGLMPAQFWSLTYREFQLKHAAFTRAEGRARALMLSHAVLTGNFKKQDRAKIERHANRLRQYPVKKWLMEDDGP